MQGAKNLLKPKHCFHIFILNGKTKNKKQEKAGSSYVSKQYVPYLRKDESINFKCILLFIFQIYLILLFYKAVFLTLYQEDRPLATCGYQVKQYSITIPNAYYNHAYGKSIPSSKNRS